MPRASEPKAHFFSSFSAPLAPMKSGRLNVPHGKVAGSQENALPRLVLRDKSISAPKNAIDGFSVAEAARWKLFSHPRSPSRGAVAKRLSPVI